MCWESQFQRVKFLNSKVQVWGRSKDLSYAATTAAKVLSFYEDYFQIPYPLLDLKMAAIPGDVSNMHSLSLI